MKKIIPAAIIMDIVFKEGEIAGTEAVNKLKNKLRKSSTHYFHFSALMT